MQAEQARLLGVLALLALWIALVLLGTVTPAAGDELDYGLVQHRVYQIELRGNQTLSAGELKSVLQIEEPHWLHPFSTPTYRPDLIGTQLRLLERYYQQRGFHQVAVALDTIIYDQESRGDVISITIQEGPRTYLDEVIFTGYEPLSLDGLQAALVHRQGDPAPAALADYGRDIYGLRSLYWDHAYLDVAIEPVLTTVPTEDPDRWSATIEYHIEPGIPYRVGNVDISGLEHTREQLIERELRLSAGDPFDWRQVERSRRQLLETGLLRDVSLTPANVDSSTGRADLLVRVVERRPAFTEIGAGIGSRERVRLLGAWGHNNLWGSGRRVLVRGKLFWNVEEIQGAGGDPQPEINYRGDLFYINPHVQGSRFQFDLNLYGERETRGESSLNLETLGASVGTQFRGGVRLLNTLAFQIEETDPRLHPSVQDTQLSNRFAQTGVGRTQTRSLVHTLFEENRDNIFQPHKGSLVTLQTEIAGGLLGGHNSFFKLVGAIHLYRPSPIGGTLAFRVSAGVARPYGSSLRVRGSDGVPYADRFFAGGVSSVRGYRESSLGPQITNPVQRDSLQFSSDVPLPDDPARGGNYLLLTNVEYRFPLPLLSRWSLQGVLFMDGGNVWERARDIRLRGFRLRSYPRDPDDSRATKLWDYRYSVGTGLRLATPFGPFRFDVGFPLKRAEGDERVLYHFSLGYPF
jgi:outer membrane protein insertion porin family